MQVENKLDEARLKAIETGRLKYQGNPCKHGHNGIRYSSTGGCVDCTVYYRALKKGK